MIINHPLLGPCDAQEFTYRGDARLIDRPDGMTASALTDQTGAWVRFDLSADRLTRILAPMIATEAVEPDPA